MSRPRILLIGCNGQVGWELVRTLAPLAEVVAVDHPGIDLADADSLRSWIGKVQPGVIVNAAAHTAVDKAESEPDRAQALNATGPGILAQAAQAAQAWLVHYSTDYVFDGTASAPYTESAEPNPLSTYGRSKLAGDEAIRRSGCNHLIFRLCWVYGARGHNFLRTMIGLAREREELRVVSDQFGSPTWSRMIAEATAQALARVLCSTGPDRFSGTYHLAASGHTTWHGFAESIVQALPEHGRKCRRVTPIRTSEYPLPAKRPAWSALDCTKLERTFGLRLPDWRESLRCVMEDIT